MKPDFSNREGAVVSLLCACHPCTRSRREPPAAFPPPATRYKATANGDRDRNRLAKQKVVGPIRITASNVAVDRSSYVVSERSMPITPSMICSTAAGLSWPTSLTMRLALAVKSFPGRA